jgi:apolipoprotein N-acyltransferase
LSAQPVFDFLPRECAIFVMSAALFHVVAHAPSSGRWRYAAAYILGLGFFTVLLYWVVVAMVEYGHMHILLACFALFLMVSVLAFFTMGIAVAYDFIRPQRGWESIWAYAALVVIFEYVRGAAGLHFPWGLWGYSLARWPLLLSWARWGGVYLISFWIALLSSSTLLAYSQRCYRSRLFCLGFWFIFSIGGGLIGHIELFQKKWSLPEASVPSSTVRVGIIQANIGQDLINTRYDSALQIVERHIRMSRNFILENQNHPPDFLVWPESSYAYSVSSESQSIALPGLGVPLIVGASVYSEVPTLKIYNSALWIAAQHGHILDRYDKRQLVPFGEFVPFGEILPIQKMVPNAPVDLTPGTDPRPIGPWKMGMMICFDGVFPETSRQSVLAGAAFLVNMTNDAWYGVSSAPYQHRDFYILRAIETGRYVVRAANTGISTVIDSVGRVGQSSTLNTSAGLIADIKLRHSKTFYVLCGDWIVWVSCLILVVIGLKSFKRRGNPMPI